MPTLPRLGAKEQQWGRGLVRRECDVEVPHDAREHECRLLERKSCADADARFDAEWQIVVAIDLLSSPPSWQRVLPGWRC